MWIAVGDCATFTTIQNACVNEHVLSVSSIQHPIVDLLWNFVIRLFFITHNLQPESCIQMAIKDESLYRAVYLSGTEHECGLSGSFYVVVKAYDTRMRHGFWFHMNNWNARNVLSLRSIATKHKRRHAYLKETNPKYYCVIRIAIATLLNTRSN